MKHSNRLPVVALIVICISLASAQSNSSRGGASRKTYPAGPITSWKQIPIPLLHPFNPQQPRRIELANGLVIFLQEDHELPKIDGVIRIRGGGRDVPADKLGMGAIYGRAWRTGGTKSKTGDDLDDFLETRAARVETAVGIDSTFLSWSSLKGDFDQVWPVVVDLLQNPEFRQGKIDLAKRQIISAISRRNDEVFDIAQREANKLSYGVNNPYARTPEYSTVAAVTRDDLVNWHKRTVSATNMILGVTGDFDSSEMERRLRDAFANWPRGERFEPVKTEFHDPVPGIYFVEKDDVNQSVIIMVDLGFERRNPDYYALEVMNELFGGGFSSRLFVNIRTKLGLAYFVGGGVGSEFDHPGVTSISMSTKSSTTAAAIDALKKQINDLVQGSIKEAEVKKAKDGILNSFIFEFDSKEKVQEARMGYEFYGYPADFLEQFRAGVEKVTVADVERVAKKYVHPEKLAVLVVGNSKEFDRPLSSFGKVTPIDITIPGSPK
ncbi:MAG TPA: pitrilysin family protein [Candidatus Angelobacter sp.]|jgi:zinc protease|nr:pitrilysin family protein [Candidatus Angelobacter sp.]